MGQNGYGYHYCSGYWLNLSVSQCLHSTGSLCMFPFIHSDVRMSLNIPEKIPPNINFSEKKLQPYIYVS